VRNNSPLVAAATVLMWLVVIVAVFVVLVKLLSLL